MDEEQTNEKEEPVNAETNTEKGDKYETTPVIERAREERERMETVVKELREENTRRELIMAKQALGGNSEAGQSPAQPKEETPKEYNDRVEKEISEGKHGD